MKPVAANCLKKACKEYRFLGIILLLYILSYGLHFSGLQHDWPTSVDNYYGLTRSIVERGTLDRNYDFELCKSNNASFECIDAGSLSLGVGGNAYSKFPPGSSFLGVPFYYAAYAMGFGRTVKLASLFFLNTLVSIGILFFIYEIAKMRVNAKTAKRLVYVSALGTIIYAYSQTFATDVLAAFLVISSFYFFLKFVKNKKYAYAFLSGLPLGYLYLTKPPLLVAAGVLFLAYCYLSYKKNDYRDALLFTAGFGVFFLVGGLYYQMAFGGFFRTGYESIIDNSSLASGAIQTYNELYMFRNNPLVQAPAILLGILMVSPFMIFSLLQMYKNRSLENKIIGAIALLSLLVFGTFYSPFGAWCFGPRLELFLFPLLMLPLADSLKALGKDGRYRKIFWILVALSLAINATGALNFTAWNTWSDFDRTISALARLR